MLVMKALASTQTWSDPTILMEHSFPQLERDLEMVWCLTGAGSFAHLLVDLLAGSAL